MSKVGILVAAAALLTPFIWLWSLYPQHDSVALTSQYFGMAALIAMGLVQLMATRAPGLSVVFGPLDKAYVLHKWLAVMALFLSFLHDTIDAEIDGLGPRGALFDAAETAGEIGFYGLLLLGFATIIPFIPYQLWRVSHKFIGAFFALSAFHFLFIQKPFTNADPLGLYVSAFCAIGVGSYLYMLLYHILNKGHRYRVAEVTHMGDVTEVSLAPTGRGLRHKAGQFAFFEFDVPGLDEVHPFTISSAPQQDRKLSVSIKALGDYTRVLNRKVEAGTEVAVRGPFGGFTRSKGKAPQLWVAGGIGITPFLSWLRDEAPATQGPVWLYYCVSTQDAPYVQELSDIAAKHPNLNLNIIVSGTERLSAQRIQADIGADLKGIRAYFCGPSGLREALEQGLEHIHFHAEAFEIRSGIGVRKGSAWLYEKIGQPLLARFQ